MRINVDLPEPDGPQTTTTSPATTAPAGTSSTTSGGDTYKIGLEAPLTGESYPRHKRPEAVAVDVPPGDRSSAVFQGTHVVSGSGTAVVVATGSATEFGRISAELGTPDVTTGFERGIARFGRMLVNVMLALVAGIFVVNLLLHRPVVDAFLFSLALAVGLTPQLLPAIVSVSLSSGARRPAGVRHRRIGGDRGPGGPPGGRALWASNRAKPCPCPPRTGSRLCEPAVGASPGLIRKSFTRVSRWD